MKNYLLILSFSLLLIIPKIQFAQWTKVLNDTKYYPVGIEFKDENTAFAAGYYNPLDSVFIIRSLDGGNTWEEILTLSYLGNAAPRCFDFINDTLGICGGQDGVLYRTIDGGNSWHYFSYIQGTYDISIIRFFNESIGLANGARTLDGGINWTFMEIGIMDDIFITNDSSAFITSWKGIFHTADYGESWLKVDPFQNEEFNSVCMADEFVGYAAKDPNEIFKSTDGGFSWFLISSVNVDDIKQIRFTDANTGYILTNSSMRLLKTTDGGLSWDYVLFGNDESKQMAFANEETILVPTVNGIIYKTSNGGGDHIMPSHLDIDWYSKIGGSAYIGPSDVCLDTNSFPIIADNFYDSLFVDNSIIHISNYPQNSSAYILKYDSWGTIEWSRVIEKQYEDVYAVSCTVDNNNNLYLVYGESNPGMVKLVKYSNTGDSLWTVNLGSNDSTHWHKIKTSIEGNVILAGSFEGTLSFENNSIYTNIKALFLLELNPNGNFVSLTKSIESSLYIGDIIFDININESICLSFKAIGDTYINQDTIWGSGNFIIYLDADKNLLWYNTRFNDPDDNITHIQFDANSQILLLGRDKINDSSYSVVLKYNEIGIATDSTFISSPGGIGNRKFICPTANNRILATGPYNDMVIIEDDTLFGFDRNSNSYIYTLSDNLELIKSRQITGTDPSSIIEYQHNSYFVGNLHGEDYPVFFDNDTIYKNENDNFFIAKLNSSITPVSEKVSHNKLMVYPNPSTGLFSVVLPGGQTKNAFIEIFNITGQKVYEGLISEHNQTMDLSKLNEGIYFIQLNFEGEIFSQKIILQ